MARWQWFEQQLDHTSVRESATGAAVAGWFPRLQDSAEQIWRNDRNDVQNNWEYARDLGNYSMLRRIYSTRTVFESMVEFWSNHFHIDAQHFPGFTQRPAYDATIRDHALGTFEELLVAASLHPAMLMFLDNWKSVRNAPNENQGRELLELHTVGAAAGYTEQMVKDSAKLLSGHTVRRGHLDGVLRPEPAHHRRGAGARVHAPQRRRRQPATWLRTTCATSPTTRPPRSGSPASSRSGSSATSPRRPLVDRVADAFLASGTDIKATLRALVTSDEFWASAGRKVRTPIDDVVATCRVIQVQAEAPVNLELVRPRAVVDRWAARWSTSGRARTVPPTAPTVWASTTRMLNSWRHALAAGRRLVARRRGDATSGRWRSCRSPASASTSSSTTSAAWCSAGRSTEPAAQGGLRGLRHRSRASRSPGRTR